jgi:glyoxylase-like metal-dependent hydrolase (beta-lactamase superfamily II)
MPAHGNSERRTDVPIFRQLFDPQSSTYSYLLGDARSREAVLIDPVFEHARRDAALVHELDLVLKATVETHVHADHVTGAWLHKRRFGSAIMLAAASGAAGADRYLVDGERVTFGDRHLAVRATPGHTQGCLTFVLDDASIAFTGDCLLIRGSGRTDFQQGDPHAMFHSVRERILTLPPSCLLYPAHDYRGLTVTSVAEELRFNPRMGGDIGEADFVGYMRNLGLPHPKLMDIAVPANLRCGNSESGIHTAPRRRPSGPPNSSRSRTSTTCRRGAHSSSASGLISQNPANVYVSGAQSGSAGSAASDSGRPQRRFAGTAMSISFGCGSPRLRM